MHQQETGNTKTLTNKKTFPQKHIFVYPFSAQEMGTSRRRMTQKILLKPLVFIDLQRKGTGGKQEKTNFYLKLKNIKSDIKLCRNQVKRFQLKYELVHSTSILNF